jgi:tetratricopeptide (TPR) repeat protein
MQSDHIEASQIRRFEQQYEENPESFVFARLADAHRKAGNAERGLEILERGLDRHPEYMSAHIVHARCLMDLGRHEGAVEAWSRVLELDPQNLVALRALAELAIAAGDRAVARAWAERLLHVDPLNEEAARLVAETAPDIASVADHDTVGAAAEREGLDATGEPARGSAADTSEPGRSSRHSGMITETMADLYVRQGLYEEAAYIYWELVKRQPADPNLRERLAEAQALASGASKLEGERAVVSLSTGTPGSEEPSREEVAEAASGRQRDEPEGPDGVAPSSADPAEAGGIRSHLQALIRGVADIELPVLDDPQTETDRRSSGRALPPKDPEGDRSASGFGEWLRRHRQ